MQITSKKPSILESSQLKNVPSFLQEKWNEIAEMLLTTLEERSGYSIRTWLQGSYKFATMIRPVSLFDEYDVDLGVYFCWNSRETGTPSPEQLKDWVQASLLDFSKTADDAKEVEEPAKERCSRIWYEKQFHIDVPAYHLGTRELENEERTAYFGRHFMDCIVRLNGKATALKRVPAYVRTPTFPKQLPKKPWYRRFVTRRR